MRLSLPVVAFALAAGPLSAQTSGPTIQAAETITAQDVARHIGAIAHDSMGGRNTPSPGLEKTAQYVADQFKKFGLKPGGDNGGWIQRYPFRGDSAIMAPNTVGILEGSDPKLKHEYIVFSAHMDHIGIGSRVRNDIDSINNGADDNASGTAGILELVEAFSQLGSRPRRSVIFLTVSGEEKGLWGSKYFAEHPPVPLEQLIANINMDMIGRSRGDTVKVFDGSDSSAFGAIVNRVASAHPELQLNIRVIARVASTDQASFSRKGIPALSFHTGTWHPDYHRVTDSPEKINAETEARIVRLVFHVGWEVAGADQRLR